MSAQEWDRQELLPGPTTKQWARAGLWCLGATGTGAAGGLICAFTLVARRLALDPVTVGFLVLVVGGLCAAWFCNIMMNRKERAELAAGYTTSAQGNNEVVRLHSPTGVVMRNAGEPNLTKLQWEAAMARVIAYKASINTEEPPKRRGAEA